jgi:hypothetical protein
VRIQKRNQQGNRRRPSWPFPAALAVSLFHRGRRHREDGASNGQQSQSVNLFEVLHQDADHGVAFPLNAVLFGVGESRASEKKRLFRARRLVPTLQ